MATISSLGVGSGLDIKSIIEKTMELEQIPLQKLQKTASQTNAQLSAFGQIKSQLANLQDQAAKLAAPELWSALTANSSNSATVAAAVTAGAVPSSFSVEISQLAKAQSVATGVVATDAKLGGKITIDLGQWAGDPANQFTPKTGATAVSVEIGANDKLSDVARKINEANAGVSATILKDASGERLLVRASATGEANGFRITTSDLATDSTLDALVYDPENASSGTGSTLSEKAQDTIATINGVEVRSSNNQFKEVVAGVNLTVNQVTTGSPVTVTIKTNSDGMRTAIKNFTESYNSISNALAEMTKYDAATKTAGTLQGDATAIGLQNTLRRMLGGLGGSGDFKSLSALGVGFDAKGMLTINDSKLNAALEKPETTKAFLVGDANAPGLAVRIRDFASNLISASGSISTRNSSLKASIDRNSKAQEQVQDRMSLIEERLTKRYTALDSSLSSLKALGDLVNQQISSWNNQKG